MPSSKAHYDDLRRLTPVSWLASLKVTLTTPDSRPVPLPPPMILSRNVRTRGPAAKQPADRDTAVDMTSYRAALSFGSVPPGDYILKAQIAGLTSAFPFAVRTGSEAQFRDHYLRIHAGRTADYATFRRLQLERLDRDPARLDALYDLIDRALVNGSLAETTGYFDRAITAANLALQKATDPNSKAHIQNGIFDLRQVRSALPEYFSKRNVWTLTRDMKDGHYSIRDRASGTVVRDFKARRDR